MQTFLISQNDALYEKALSLRHRLFFLELGLPKEVLQDALEDTALHVVTVHDGNLLAYARLNDVGSGRFKISQVVVEPDFQGHGYGKGMIVYLINLAKDKGAMEIELGARVSATGFYRALGFIKYGGVYKSKLTGIPHIKMKMSEHP